MNEIKEQPKIVTQENADVLRQAEQIYVRHHQQIYRQTDRMFAALMIIQWFAGLAAALFLSPRAWTEQSSEINIHVWAALILGAAITFFPVLLAFVAPGKRVTRYSIAVGQMLMSSLLIHLTGGRIETHFHIFGSLAFLSFYRDWRVLIPATIIATLDHLLRGIFYPQSVFGVATAEHWRWIEHAGWIVFEDFFLILSCLRGQKEMRQIAENTAHLDVNETRYRAVTDSASDAIITFDESSRILFANRSAEKIFGYQPAELIGENLSVLIPEKAWSECGDVSAAETAAIINSQLFTAPAKLGIDKNISRQALEVPARHRNDQEFMIEISFGEYNSGVERNYTAVIRDITDRKRIEERLRKSEEYRNFFKLANDAIIIYEPESRIILDVNDYACKVFGYERDEFIGLEVNSLSRAPRPSQINSALPAAAGDSEHHFGNRTTDSYETIQYRRDGTPLNLLITTSLIEFSGVPAILSINRDITLRISANTALRESEYKFRTLIENMSEGLLQLDTENKIVFTNRRFCEMTGFSEDALLGKRVSEILVDQEGQLIFEKAVHQQLQSGSESHEIRLQTGRGEKIWSLFSVVPVQDTEGQTIGSMSIHTDITQRKQAEEEMRHHAMHDKLTNLPNRALFLEHLRRVMGRSPLREKTFAVLFLDFDGFKLINDSLGHLAGDTLLKLISRRLEGVTRANDVVARLGGDEFTILLDELNDPGEALVVVERIQQLFRESFNLGGREVFTSASIGIAFRDAKFQTPDEMLRAADIAMYRAKTSGKARYEIFSQAMHEQVNNRLQLETEMRLAIERREFQVFYQPIMDITSNQLIGFEALARWFHPERGQILPSEFIPVAEETGLIVPLGEWILRESCRQTRDWHLRYPHQDNLSVSVNLSCKQFMQPDLVERVTVILGETNLPPQLLRLEITESHMMENTKQAVIVINSLRELGVQISIDDFGTGYSSLSYLQQLPINYLKIDRSFISLMKANVENGEIVRAIVMLAKNLNLEVIAEGIETEEQAQQLLDLNCSFGQGFLYSQPTDAAQAEEHLLKFPQGDVSKTFANLGRID